MFLSLATVLIAFWIMNADTVKSSDNNSNIVLKISSDKETYILGEVINLQFELKGKNDEPITLRSVPTVETGYMRVWIASPDRNFKEYEGDRWGLFDGNKSAQQAKSIKSQAAILFNRKPVQYSSLTENQIKTDYAISESGVYFIKASAIIWNEQPKSDEDKMVIESEPIQIVVNEPVGDDLEVWKRIKDNGEFAYFIQQGSFRVRNIEERKKLLEEVEQITTKYPNSLLTNQMKQSLEKFRETEEKIKESSPKNKQNNQEKKP
jgi:hypothetical protein